MIGGLIFFFYSLNTTTSDENTIMITQVDIDRLNSVWKKKFLREPTKTEFQELLDNKIYQEIMYKEALKLGLDKGDLIIKRRLAQKMEFISSDMLSLEEIDDAKLKEYLELYKDHFYLPTKISFTQKLQGNDSFMIDKYQNNLTEIEVSRIFGRNFSHKLFKLEVNLKEYEIKSGYGIHTVVIKSKIENKLPEFNTIKLQVKKEYSTQMREEQNQLFYKNLKQKYDIKISQ